VLSLCLPKLSVHALALFLCALAVDVACGQAPSTRLLPPSWEHVVWRLDQLERENAEFRAQLQSLETEAAARDCPGCEPGAADAWPVCSDPLCNDDGRALFYRESQRATTIDWSGFIQLDSGWIAQDAANIAAVGDIEDTTGLRRVRLRASGRLLPRTSYVVDLDFAASGHPSFRDVKFTLHEQPIFQNIVIGYYAQPFGLEAMTSGRELLLMERELQFAFAPFRQTGIGARGTALNETVSWFYSGYRYPTDSFGVSEGGSGGWGFASRGTAIPYYNEENNSLVHFGASYSFADPGTNQVQYAIEPGFFVKDPTSSASGSTVPVFVDTGNIPTSYVNVGELEFAAQLGSLNLQAETVGAFVEQIDGPRLAFSGAMAKMAYVFTGETHAYDRQEGIFRRVQPTEPGSFLSLGGGAWEGVAAWSYIDLNDQNIQGGTMQTFTMGVNRYLNNHVKFQVNIVRALLDDPDTGPSAATVAAFRAQAEF
jgi:phosphate-selective porin OprO/OprP